MGLLRVLDPLCGSMGSDLRVAAVEWNLVVSGD